MRREEKAAKRSAKAAAEAAAAPIPTFEQQATRYHEMKKPEWSNPKAAAQFLQSLKQYTFKHIGAKPVAAITPADVLASTESRCSLSPPQVSEDQ